MLNQDFRDILSEFIEGDVEFLVVGAYAVATHGIARATGDIDFWIRISPENAHRVLDALHRFGTPLEELTAADLQEENVVVQIGREPSRVDIMTSIDGVEFDDAWAHKHEVHVAGLAIPVIGRQQLIRNKRATGRLRDLADVEAILERGRESDGQVG